MMPQDTGLKDYSLTNDGDTKKRIFFVICLPEKLS
jgi:hypothetical protein